MKLLWRPLLRDLRPISFSSFKLCMLDVVGLALLCLYEEGQSALPRIPTLYASRVCRVRKSAGELIKILKTLRGDLLGL